MERNIIDIGNLAPRAEFAGISAQLGRVKVWHNVALDDAQTLIFGALWLTDVSRGTISVKTAIRGLRLAMSLKSMNPRNPNNLWEQQVRTPEGSAETLARVVLPNLDLFSDTPFALRVQQVIPGPAVQIPRINNQLVVNAGVARPAAEQEDTDQQKRTAYCFLAAYMMKLIVKSAENIVAGVENMQQRYASFYGTSRTVSEFTMAIAQAKAYKEAVLNQAHISLTYTHAIAYTHQYKVPDLNPREVGVLSYLGFLPFSYTGMHAYTLMMKLRDFTNIPLDKLLSLFYSDITAPALVKIAAIMRNFERTVEYPDRDITFRYCTIWGPQYFSSLRSRNCTHLLYIVACAWKKLAAGNDNADPERIAAMSKLSEHMKRTLKTAGEIVGDFLKRTMSGDVSASPAFAMAINPIEGPAPEAEVDWATI